MNTLEAFARGQASRGQRARVFDWDKAARIIKERGANEAWAGLAGDWGYTGGRILSDGKPVPSEETYVFLASTWATLELEVDGDLMDCWTWVDESGWDEDTYWPASALAILEDAA